MNRPEDCVWRPTTDAEAQEAWDRAYPGDVIRVTPDVGFVIDDQISQLSNVLERRGVRLAGAEGLCWMRGWGGAQQCHFSPATRSQNAVSVRGRL